MERKIKKEIKNNNEQINHQDQGKNIMGLKK